MAAPIGSRTVTTITGTDEHPASIHVFVEVEVAMVSATAEDRVSASLDALP